MRFIKKINPLHIYIVICFANDGLCWELVNIYDRDRILTSVISCADGADVLNEIIFRIYFLHMEATGGKFLSGLCQQVQTIYNEVELCNPSLFLVIIPKVTYIVKGQGGFAAALGMPNDTVLDAGI